MFTAIIWRANGGSITLPPERTSSAARASARAYIASHKVCDWVQTEVQREGK